MKPAIPSLSVNGWIKDSRNILLKLYEYFLTSEFSQSNIYLNEIASLKYIIKKSNNPDEIVVIIKETLETMYTRYFQSVIVTVDYELVDSTDVYKINIDVIDDENKTYSLNRETSITKNNIITMDQQQIDIRK